MEISASRENYWVKIMALSEICNELILNGTLETANSSITKFVY
jgi:hypothetical protein